MTKQVLQQALEALENGKRVRNCEGGTKYQPDLEDAAIEALREALAQQSELGNASKSEQLLASYDHAVRAEFQRTKAALAQQGERQRIQELEQELAAEIELRGKLEQECVNWRVKYTNLEMAQQGEQQPVAYMSPDTGGLITRAAAVATPNLVTSFSIPLYAGAAPAAQPYKGMVNMFSGLTIDPVTGNVGIGADK